MDTENNQTPSANPDSTAPASAKEVRERYLRVASAGRVASQNVRTGFWHTPRNFHLFCAALVAGAFALLMFTQPQVQALGNDTPETGVDRTFSTTQKATKTNPAKQSQALGTLPPKNLVPTTDAFLTTLVIEQPDVAVPTPSPVPTPPPSTPASTPASQPDGPTLTSAASADVAGSNLKTATENRILVVVFSTSDEEEAIEYADELLSQESTLQVVKSDRGLYAVAIGSFNATDARAVQQRVVRNKLAADAYLMNGSRVVEWLQITRKTADPERKNRAPTGKIKTEHIAAL